MRCLVVLIMCLFSLSALAEVESVSIPNKVRPAIYNDVWKRQYSIPFHIRVTSENLRGNKIDEINIQFKYHVSHVFIPLNKRDRVKLRDVIKKYKRWNKKADRKKVTLQKDIDEFEVSGAGFGIGRDWYLQLKPFKITGVFFSQRKGKHQLVLRFSEITASSNKHITHRPEDLYFDWSDVVELEKILKEKNLIRTANKILKKKRSIAEDFK